MGDTFGFGDRPGAQQYARIMQDSLEPHTQPKTYRAPSTTPQRANTIERPILDAVASVTARVAADSSIPETQARQEARIAQLESQLEQKREELREPAREFYTSLEHRLSDLHNDVRSPYWGSKRVEIAPYSITSTKTTLRITEYDEETERIITYRQAPRGSPTNRTYPTITWQERPSAAKRELNENQLLLLVIAGAGTTAVTTVAIEMGELMMYWQMSDKAMWLTALGIGITAATALYKGIQDRSPAWRKRAVAEQLSPQPEEAITLMHTIEHTLDAVTNTMNVTVREHEENFQYALKDQEQQARITELERQQRAVASTTIRPDRIRS